MSGPAEDGAPGPQRQAADEPRARGGGAPSDRALTREGLEARGTGRILILACGALAREILAIRDASGLAHIDLHCLPAILHNRPERIAPAVEAAVRARRADYDRVFVAYADCGTGGALARTCEGLGVEMIAGPHCYAFYEGLETFAARDEIDAFYLTDFLCRQFDAFVWEPLGLDRHPELRDMYFGQYRTLVYQAQADDPDLTARAEDCARRMGLAFERRFTGFGALEGAVRGA